MNTDGMIQSLRAAPYHITNERVLEAMRRIPREEFLPDTWKHAAYDDRALPIGDDQTISQPYMVAFMTSQLDPQPDDKILEIGTGSGYQAAVLGELAAEVYSIEIVGALAERARATLKRLGYSNIFIRHDRAMDAWVEQAPFNGIIVTCAPKQLPDNLRHQLADGGRLVYPAGASTHQFLYLQRRDGDQWTEEKQFAVRFVPMTDEVR